ncbi:type VI secretion system tip protein VgrG [Bacteroidales bacterium OttesenSCG-928-A17]|nr:type VI secretion system tip protein VgrG [Bacteroidales bacterium OttesenSCG-928-A17]
MNNTDDRPIFTLYSEGNKIPSQYQVTHATIHSEANRIGKAMFKLYASDKEKQAFDISDGNTFKHGSAIKLEVKHNKKEKTLFEGFVISTEIEINSGQADMLIVECRDYGFLTTLGRKNSVYEESTDSDVFKKIISSYSDLSLKVEDSGIKHSALVQYYCTDWDFILSRADISGMIVISSGKEISIRKPEIDAEPIAEYTYGVNILEFNGKLSLSNQYAEINTASWNFSKQEIVEVTNKKQTTNKQGDLSIKNLAEKNSNILRYQTDASINKESLNAWADALASKNALSRYSGHFTTQGTSDIIPGCMVELKGLGKRFDGKVFVNSVEHIIDEDIWHTKIGMGLSDYSVVDQPDIVAPLASGFLPGIQGLHIGIVRQLQDDPLSGFRILVEYPLMNGNKNSIWSRLLTPYSGNNAGILFIPEVGEEVVVGFFNNDPCHPVVLGGLYNEKHKPPVDFSEKNEIKTITTKEKLTLEFNDTKKTISIKTPGGSHLNMNDEDKSVSLGDTNGNSILLNSDGITFKTNKNILLEAKGEIKTDAGSKLQLASKSSDVSIEGLNIKATAKVGVTCKGNATAEISSSGNTTVKGAMVMIN